MDSWGRAWSSSALETQGLRAPCQTPSSWTLSCRRPPRLPLHSPLTRAWMVSPGWHPPPASAHPVPSSQLLVPNTHLSCRSTLLHLHIRDHRAAQSCHHCAQQVRDHGHCHSPAVTPGHLYVLTPSLTRSQCSPGPLLSLLLSPLLAQMALLPSKATGECKILNQPCHVSDFPVSAMALRVEPILLPCGPFPFSDVGFLFSTPCLLPLGPSVSLKPAGLGACA